MEEPEDFGLVVLFAPKWSPNLGHLNSQDESDGTPREPGSSLDETLPCDQNFSLGERYPSLVSQRNARNQEHLLLAAVRGNPQPLCRQLAACRAPPCELPHPGRSNRAVVLVSAVGMREQGVGERHAAPRMNRPRHVVQHDFEAVAA